MKQETLEEVANEYAKNRYSLEQGFPEEDYYISFLSFRAGAKWQQERSYSEEEVLKAQQAILCNIKDALMNENYIIEYIEQFKNK